MTALAAHSNEPWPLLQNTAARLKKLRAKVIALGSRRAISAAAGLAASK